MDRDDGRDVESARRRSAGLATCNGSRREFLTSLAALGLSTAVHGSLLTQGFANGAERPGQTPKVFRIWVWADAHVGTDKRNGRDSLAEAIRQSESRSGFDWDMALDLGDVSGEQGTPKDAEGEELVRQFGVLKRHRREQIYDLSGNHDRSGLDETQAWWWRKWIDPTGEHTEFSHVGAARGHFPSTERGSGTPFESGIFSS